MLTTLLILLALIVILWLWQSHLKAREAALTYCQKACRQAQVQLLDETVALEKWSLKRNLGQLTIQRTYQFDYLWLEKRLRGKLILQGQQLVHCDLTIQGSDIIFEAVNNADSFEHQADDNQVIDFHKYHKK